MKKNLLYISALAFVVGITSCGGDATDDSKDIAKELNDEKFDSTNIEGDTKFAVNAADGSMMEIELGKLALTNGSAPEVKNLGQQMINDHSAANDELKLIAQQKNISLPASLSEDKQKEVNDMAAKQGADFDRAYSAMMVDDHERDVKEFKHEADKGNDPDIKAWAANKISVLEHHLELSKTTRDAVKDKK